MVPCARTYGETRRVVERCRCSAECLRIGSHVDPQRRSLLRKTIALSLVRRTRLTRCFQSLPREEKTPNTEKPEVSKNKSTDEASTKEDKSENGSSSNEAKSMTWSQLVPMRIRVFWSESTSAEYVKECFATLWKHLWPLVTLAALNSAARFVLVWTLYKTVCAVAVRFFGIPASSIPQEMIPTTGSTGDPNVYQQLADITFLLFKPFDFLLKGIFIAAGWLICWNAYQKTDEPSNPKRFRKIRYIWKGIVASLTSMSASIRRSPNFMLTYIVTGALTAFYQGLCLLIVPLLYALKRLMNIQLAPPAALLQKMKWKEALVCSKTQIEPIRDSLYFPYFLLLLTPKVLGFTRDMVVKLFPDRLFVDVPELSWGLIAVTTVTAFLIDRMAEIFPIVIYSRTQSKELVESKAL